MHGLRALEHTGHSRSAGSSPDGHEAAVAASNAEEGHRHWASVVFGRAHTYIFWKKRRPAAPSPCYYPLANRRPSRDLEVQVGAAKRGRLTMGPLIQKNRPTYPLAMASDRSLSSASPSSRAPPESPCLAMAGAGSSTTIQRLLPIRSARPRQRFSDLLTMIDGKSMHGDAHRQHPLGLRPEIARLRAQQSCSPRCWWSWNHV